ncbi:MAG TPA: Tom37 metaxin N-terminal-like domain-containing protein [Nitrosomonas sp.]|nr:Tom37 metaxin N-terminal-like domain-containing protein [Nitrosomonas sp.]
MLKLYQFNRTWGIPNLSPFCCKVETYLRMADIDYEIVTALPPGAPKGKLPYVDDGGKIVADSHFILTHLRSSYQDLDKHLDSSQQAASFAWQHLLEDHLFWSFFISAGCIQTKTGKSTAKRFSEGCRLLYAILWPCVHAAKSSAG